MEVRDTYQNPANTFPGNMAPQGPPKSSGRFWLLGGCGCLTLLAVVCIGGGVMGYLRFLKPSIDFATESITLATESPQVKEILGEPVTADAGIQTNQIDKRIALRIPVSGPKGKGVVVVEGVIEMNAGLIITRESMTLEKDGESIDLDPEAATPDVNVIMNDDEEEQEMTPEG